MVKKSLATLPPKALTKDEVSEFKRLKKVVKDGLSTFVDVGTALKVIRDEQLYREHYKTFEAFCKVEYDLPRSHAYRLIDSSKVVENLSPIGGQILTSERQVRALAPLPQEQQVAVWKQVVEQAPTNSSGEPKISGAFIERIVEEVTGGDEEESSERESAERNGSVAGRAGEDQQVLDSLKCAVSEECRDVFASVPDFRKCMAAIDACKKTVKELSETPGGGRMDVQEIERCLGQARSLVRFGMPYTECPKCRRELDKKCPNCFGKGWIHESLYKSSASDSDKKWLESR